MHTELDSLSNSQLAEHSALEQRDFRSGKAAGQQASQELFWRAIVRRDEEAWALIYQHWSGQLLRWLLQHPLSDLALKEAEAESYLTAALSKFWQATTRSERMRAAFPSLPELLAYLRCCLNSAVLDGAREAKSHHAEVEAEQAETLAFAEPPLTDEAFWASVERALPERRERLLIYLRYVRGERPREIAARYPDEFPRVSEVYRLERNILDRLRRHPALQLWRGESWGARCYFDAEQA